MKKSMGAGGRALLLLGMLAAVCGSAEAQQIRDVFRRVNPSVVVVHTQKKEKGRPAADGELNAQNLGSGVLVSAEGRILTAAHVVQTADRVEVEFLGGRRMPARIVSMAPFADVALLQLQGAPPPEAVVATLGDSSRAEIGDQIFVIGAPYGASHSLSVGYVSARRTADQIIEGLSALEVIQTDAAIFEGNSGGPVFNLQGEIIGIISHVLTRQEGMSGPGFAVASNVARSLMLEQRRIWMGIEAWLVSGPIAAAFHLPQEAGMLVQSVAEDSLGARLGLREGLVPAVIDEKSMLLGGDVILEMLGIPVRPDGTAILDVQRRLTRMQPGDPVAVKVFRGGKIVDLSARLAD